MLDTSSLQPRLYFSYGQFLVYDRGVKDPGCLWTDAHYAQGFARRESTVSFATLLEFGYADVLCHRGAFQPDEEYERVIAVPFAVFTGRVMVGGPEEIGIERSVALPVGNYRIVAAQYLIGDEEEIVDLFIEEINEPLAESNVIVADELLAPPGQLSETAEVA